MNILLFIIIGVLSLYCICGTVYFIFFRKKIYNKIQNQLMEFTKLNDEMMEYKASLDKMTGEQNNKITNIALQNSKNEIAIRHIQNALVVTNNGFLRPTQSSMM